jgi:predicted outer membrane repeat protein
MPFRLFDPHQVIHRFTMWCIRVGLSFCIVFGLVFVLPITPVYAASITVTTTADTLDAAGTCSAITLASLPGPDGQVSLREAVCAANSNPGDDTISFSINGTFVLSGAANEDNGSSGDLDIKQSLTIVGNGVNNTIIDGGNIERIFDVFPSAASHFNVSNLSLQNGNTTSSSFKEGGAIYLHNNVTANLSDCKVNNNSSGQHGAIENRGILTIERCVFSDNATVGSGTAVAGAIRTQNNLTIRDSLFLNNSVQGDGGAIGIKLGTANSVLIERSAFVNNRAELSGGINGHGGAISTTDNMGPITISNSTFSGNQSAGDGGALYVLASGGTGTLTLINSTLTGNRATRYGGGIFQYGSNATLHNSLLSANQANIGNQDIYGSVTSDSSYNLISVNTNLSGITNGTNNNQIGTVASPINPLLGAIQTINNTQVHPLLAGSPAINAAGSANCPATDQRNVSRVASTCDIGAFEFIAPPDTTITATPPSISSSASASFSFSGSGSSPIASYQCQLDGATFAACTSPVSYGGLSQGSHTFSVRAIDTAGNTDPTPASYTWTIDTSAPDTTITANPPSITNSTNVTFSFTGSDNGTIASYQCQLDGATFAACASPVSYGGLSQGSHTFSVRAIDTAGNTDPTPASYTWTIDTSAPDTTITANPPSITNSTNASFSFTGSDNGTIASYQCQLDGAAFAACTSPISYTGLSQGTHTFSVRAIDTAGNIATPASYSWTIDTSAPDTTITANPASITNSTNASFSFTGSDDGTIASFECQIDGGAFSACTSPQAYTGLAAGSHTFAVRAIDTAGNVDSSPASYTWTIDTTTPSVTITSTLNLLTNQSPIEVNVSFSKPVSGFVAGDLIIGNATVSDFSGSGTSYSFNLIPSSDGLVTVDIPANVVVDNASNGNTAASQWSIEYDGTAPSVTVEQASTQADPTNLAPISFVVTFSEPVTGFDDLSDLQISGSAGANNASITGSGSSYTVTVSGMSSAGTVILSVPAGVASDNAGNANSASSSSDNSVFFDSVVPVVTGINRLDNNPSNAASVRYQVSFSKSVQQVDASDFAISASGLSGTSISSVVGSGQIYTVTLSTGSGSGSGSLRLDLLDDDSIVDAAGNTLGGSGSSNGDFTSGQSYTIDKAAPSVGDLSIPAVVAGSSELQFTLNISDSTAVQRSSIANGLVMVSGPNSFSQAATIVSVTPDSDGSPLSLVLSIAAPGGTWDHADNGAYSIALQANQLQDIVGNRSSASTLGSFTVILSPNSYSLYLPMVQRPGQADLVGSISITPNQSSFNAGEAVSVSVTITNQGTASANNFWVDLLINPDQVPNQSNIIWNEHCTLSPCYGLSWLVTQSLAPGQSITLSASQALPEYSNWSGSFAAGTSDLYLVVDSWNPGVSTGAISESNESNNVAYFGGLQVSPKQAKQAPSAILKPQPKPRYLP